jgi:hypothetical protein
MNNIIPISIAVEDNLSEMVVRSLLRQSGKKFIINACYGKKGSGYLKKSIEGFNKAARVKPFLILTDLDKTECAPSLIGDWLGHTKSDNLLFRIAVREVESWVMAHRKAFSSYFKVPEEIIPLKPDEIDNPKLQLMEIVKKSKIREYKEAIIPSSNSTATIGPNYNAVLGDFVANKWNAEKAVKYSPSLLRAVIAVRNFSQIK